MITYSFDTLFYERNLFFFQKNIYRNQTSTLTKELNDEPETILSKTDVLLNFKIQIIVVELKGLKNLQQNRVVYCTMEVDGNEKLQTDHATAQKPL